MKLQITNEICRCIICGGKMETDGHNPIGGVICSTTGNYGSQVYDCFYENDYTLFVICDKCLIKNLHRCQVSGEPPRRADVLDS